MYSVYVRKFVVNQLNFSLEIANKDTINSDTNGDKAVDAFLDKSQVVCHNQIGIYPINAKEVHFKHCNANCSKHQSHDDRPQVSMHHTKLHSVSSIAEYWKMFHQRVYKKWKHCEQRKPNQTNIQYMEIISVPYGVGHFESHYAFALFRINTLKMLQINLTFIHFDLMRSYLGCIFQMVFVSIHSLLIKYSEYTLEFNCKPV